MVAQILRKDRQLPCEGIDYETSISCSPIHTNLTERLGMRNVVARWVSHCLSKMEKQQRLEICSEHLYRYTIIDEAC